MKLFGTSGIRGIYGKEITEELVYKIASIFGEETLVVGRDTRESGLKLFEALSQTGKKIIDLGVVPTPTLAFATVKYECVGIMITASHNPPEYNGLKLFLEGGEISREKEAEIEQQYALTKIKKETNQTKITKDEQIIEEHKNMIKKLIDVEKIKQKKFKVVIDCNGAAYSLTPYLLMELGCKVISVNAEKSGFNRPSEPNKQNLKHLETIVKATNADIGFAHDGDGDRVVVIDETGEMLPLDVQLAIMIEHEISTSKNKKIVSTVEASLLIRETIEKNGGEPIITRVSSVDICHIMKEDKINFGGEPCGEYIFGNATYTPDGPLAVAKFLEILSKKGKLSKIKKAYKSYPILRDKFKCIDNNEKMKNIIEKIKQKKIQGKITTIDGLRVDEKDGWFLIRASGTEPIIRLTAEYKNKEKLDKRTDELKKIIVSEIDE
ncbi:MAG TPA: phosphoglucosamine mutase [Candidatus Bilamarchaeaceae archaeon]|nr:phosphoglucosamine mutase [Candidatus Bilamarchaeaceae archaeon]